MAPHGLWCEDDRRLLQAVSVRAVAINRAAKVKAERLPVAETVKEEANACLIRGY